MTSPDRAEPLYFGGNRALFGWLHRQSSATTATLGLVICAPLGYEAVCSHRTMKHIAVAAANAGIPALRFDYDGSGDSAGDELDAQRVPQLLRSIQDAIDALKAHSGVERICLLGIRLGATLAAVAATERNDIEGIACVAPVVNVRTYLRELRALAMAGSRHEPPSWATIIPDLQEAAGFSLTKETRDALSSIDLLKLPAPAPHVLIFNRDDLPANDTWAEKLKISDAQVEQQQMQGYAEMLLDSHEAVVPTNMVLETAKWLQRRQATLRNPDRLAATNGLSPVNNAEFSIDLDGRTALVRETAVFLEPTKTLFGVVTQPLAESTQPASLIVMLNSGAVHHIGPNRLYVTLARQWAAEGAIVLRMDLAGLGDSGTYNGEPENQVYAARATADVTTAIQYMQRHHAIADYHAIGLCSGAYHSLKSAFSGIAFRSIVAINPLTFSWRPGLTLAYPQHRIAADVMRYKKTAFQFSSWKKLLRGQVDIGELLQVLIRRGWSVTTHAARDMGRRVGIPLQNDLGTELRKLSRQNTKALFVFAAGDPGLDLLHAGGGFVVKQMQRNSLLRIEIIDSADHTFTPRWSREALINVLTAHIRDHRSSV